MAKNSRVSFAVVGCGVVSGYGHLPAIAGMPEVAELRAVVDVEPRVVEAVGKKYPMAKGFTDYREMLRAVDVEVVVIATRTDTHAAIATACLEAGKHILLEKPPATTVEDAYQLLATAKRTGLVCGINFILRYQEGCRKLKAWCEAGEIGRLRAVRIIDDWWGADHRGANPGRGMRLLGTDGSVIIGEGIHQADLARWFSGSEFAGVHCVGTSIQHPPYPDHQAMIGTLANGVVVNIECSHGYGFSSKEGTMDRQIDLVGEKGVIKWLESGGQIMLYGKDRTVKEACAEGKQFPALYEEFIASVRAGKAVGNLPTLEDGCKALEVVIQAHEAGGREGK